MKLNLLLSNMSIFTFSIYLFLGIYVYRIDSKEKLNRLFLLLCSSFAIWSFALSFQFISTEEIYWFWNKISAIGWCTYSGISLHLVLVMTHNEKILANKKSFVNMYLPAVILLLWRIFLFGPGVTNEQIDTFALADRLYYISYGLISLFLIGQWGIKSGIKREKKQARIIFFAALLTLGMAFITGMFYPLKIAGVSDDYSHLIILILIVGLWYAIVKYKFLSLGTLIKAENIVDKVTDTIILTDSAGIIIKTNPWFEELTDYRQEEVVGRPLEHFLSESYETIYPKNGDKKAELHIITKKGEEIPLYISVSPVYDKSGDLAGCILIGGDLRMLRKLQVEINERKQKEDELKYQSLHDQVTGLYNRTYFELEMLRLDNEKRYPVGIVVFDVNGLKFVNDTFGHNAGDDLLRASANVIKETIRPNGIVARIGGDEFAALFIDFNESLFRSIETKLPRVIEKYNFEKTLIPLSISVGTSSSFKEYKSVFELYKEADNNMYREKLKNAKSNQDAMVKTLMIKLETREFLNKRHFEALQNLVVDFAHYIDLSEQEITVLRLLAQFHDIGKVGIPDNIFNKQKKLTSLEKNIMRRHSEIGYRISQSIPELNVVSNLILMHHERWDGEGYPLGKNKESIPLECRVFSIVDAYDAMINDRPFRKAMIPLEAMKELERNSGTQFDPILVNKFLEMIKTRKNEKIH